MRKLGLSALAGVGLLAMSSVAFAADTPATEAPATPPVAQEVAPPAPPPASAPQTTEKDPLDEIVCRKEEATVGSRLGARKVCKTRRQWRDEKRDATSPDIPDGSLQTAPGGTTS
jgi:hypothetical protein